MLKSVDKFVAGSGWVLVILKFFYVYCGIKKKWINILISLVMWFLVMGEDRY